MGKRADTKNSFRAKPLEIATLQRGGSAVGMHPSAICLPPPTPNLWHLPIETDSLASSSLQGAPPPPPLRRRRRGAPAVRDASKYYLLTAAHIESVALANRNGLGLAAPAAPAAPPPPPPRRPRRLRRAGQLLQGPAGNHSVLYGSYIIKCHLFFSQVSNPSVLGLPSPLGKPSQALAG